VDVCVAKSQIGERGESQYPGRDIMHRSGGLSPFMPLVAMCEVGIRLRRPKYLTITLPENLQVSAPYVIPVTCGVRMTDWPNQARY